MSARAIVLAAGKGTRMRSAQPKVMHDLCGRPMLWWVLQALRTAGIDDITVVTNPELDPMLAAFGVRTVVQHEQLGTGHAVRIALDALPAGDGCLVVAYGDMPLVDHTIFEDVQAAVDPDAGAALALVTARMPLPSSFGRIVRSGNAVERIVEAKDCTPEQLALDEMNAGIYAYDERALRDGDRAGRQLQRAGRVLPHRHGRAADRAAGKRVVPVPVADYRSVLGVNDRVELADARAVLNRRLCEGHMRAGVTIVDPAATYLEPDLAIGADTVIYPGTTISGATDRSARTAASARTAGSATRASPTACRFARASCSTRRSARTSRSGRSRTCATARCWAQDVHIGNFVEIKKSTLAEGVKAGHLTYLGDATIGARANIGAGTITCNYDGVRKNPTTIGADAFIGSNSSLVAPVTIGEGAVTGAGAVVIRDVPAGDKVVGNPARSIAKKPAQT